MMMEIGLVMRKIGFSMMGGGLRERGMIDKYRDAVIESTE